MKLIEIDGVRVGVGVCCYHYAEQEVWWRGQLERWGGGVVVEAKDDGGTLGAIPGELVDYVAIPNRGVAHVKNVALKVLEHAGAEVFVLVEDDCRFESATLRKLALLATEVPHYMHGPVIEWPSTWRLNGAEMTVAGLRLVEYVRRREPQDTPGVITVLTREALELAGGLDGRFIGRGHAHGEWTERIFDLVPSPLPHPRWILMDTDVGYIEYLRRPPKPPRPTEDQEVADNRWLREQLTAHPAKRSRPTPNLDYRLTGQNEPPISVCMSLFNRGDTLRPCLDSIAGWFVADHPDNELVIADFGSRDVDLEAELGARGLRCSVVQLDGYFSRARGLHRAAQAARNPLLLFLDADMLVPKSMGGYVRTFARPGEVLFPICWNLERQGGGSWRDTGFGMCAIGREDYNRVGGWALSRRRWGGEDNDLHWHCHDRGLTVHRVQVPDLAHQYHSTQVRDLYTDPEAPPWQLWTPPDERGAVMLPIEPLSIPTEYLADELLERWPFHLQTARQFSERPDIRAEETAYYAGVLAYKRAGGTLWASLGQEPSPSALARRVEEFRELFASLRDHGYDSDQPVRVRIRGRGGIGMVDGHHRLACCLVLGIDRLPAIAERHPQWVQFVDGLYEQYRAPKLYTRIDHPEFYGWEVARDTEHRAAAIAELLERGSRVLDVGSNIGGITRALARAGMRMAAIERRGDLVRLAKHIAEVERVRQSIDWICMDAFRGCVSARSGVDAVVCLSVLHHSVKRGSLEGDLRWVTDSAPVAFVELADASESQMFGYRIPGSQAELGPWLASLTGRVAEPVLEGVPKDQRQSASDRRWIWVLR